MSGGVAALIQWANAHPGDFYRAWATLLLPKSEQALSPEMTAAKRVLEGKAQPPRSLQKRPQ